MMNKFFKKVAIAVAAATIALTGTAACVSANDGMGIEQMNVIVNPTSGSGYITAKDGLNVRSMPSREGKIMNTLAFGEKVTISGRTSNGWLQVWVKDRTSGGEGTGYICEDYFSTKMPAGEKAPADTSFQNYMDNHYADDAATMSHMAHCYERVNVSNGYLALRSQPTYAAENEIEQLYNGEMVQIVGETSGSYVYVCAESGNFGWVNAGFLG